MQYPPTAARQAQPPGVIDTLSAGYAAVNRQLWVLLVPIVVDVFLWRGPQVSFSPLIHPVVSKASEMMRQALRAARGTESTNLLAALDQQRQTLMNTADSNILALSIAQGPLAVPGVAPLLGGVGDFSFVHGWGEALLILGAGLTGGLALGALFRALIAEQVRSGHPAPMGAARRTPRGVARVIGLAAVLLGVALLLGLPVLATVAAASVLAPVTAGLGAVLLLVAVLFAEVHLFFAVDAIFVSDVGPLSAIQRSVSLVRRSLLPTMGLIVLTWLILAGMDQVWQLAAALVQPPFGAVLGIVGNAYIASGLMAAGMIFYKERAGAAEAPVRQS